jgi:hypothetical protein
MMDLVSVIGRGGRLSDQVSDAIIMLIRETMWRESPHELEVVSVVGVDGQPRTIKIFPRAWLRRLERAVEAGAFARRDLKDIVDRILMTEEPTP